MFRNPEGPKSQEEIVAILLHSLLVAHKHLINCGTSQSSVNMQIEYALITAGVEVEQLMKNFVPPKYDPNVASIFRPAPK